MKGKLVKESLNECPSWEELNIMAEELFGEFGFATLDEEQMEEILGIDSMDRLNQIAEEEFGEFGFASLDEEEMEEVINKCQEGKAGFSLDDLRKNNPSGYLDYHFRK